MIAIVDEKYIQVESGSTRYVEIFTDDNDYDNLPTEGIAEGSLAYLLDSKELHYFTGESWAEVGGADGGGNGEAD